VGKEKMGKIGLTGHCKSKNHTERVKALSTQTSIPAACHGEKTTTEAYHIHPMFMNKKTGELPKQQVALKLVVPFDDRIHNAEVFFCLPSRKILYYVNSFLP
jgi:hypothetical protein